METYVTEQLKEEYIAKTGLVTSNYQAFKAELDTELNKAADGFVKIGYLLKKARDTDVLRESGYKSVTEFAKIEYGLSADVVSRYIAINDRFAEHGYSDRLAERYCNYGLAKLQEMLTLPAPIVDELSPELTREEIQTIKREFKEDQEITDSEVAIEAAQIEEDKKQEEQAAVNGISAHADEFSPDNNLEKMLYELFKECPEDYVAGMVELETGLDEVLAPSGYRIVIYRIAGVGKMMMTMKKEGIVITNMRTNEKEEYGWSDACSLFDQSQITHDKATDEGMAKEAWSKLYGMPYPETPDPAEDDSKPAKVTKPKKKESKVSVVKPKDQKKEAEAKTEIEKPAEPTELEEQPAQEDKPEQEEKSEQNERLAELYDEYNQAFEDSKRAIRNNDVLNAKGKYRAAGDILNAILRILDVDKDEEEEEND